MEKVYNYKTHNLSCSNNKGRFYSLTINFVELLFDYHTNELIDIFGFFPLVNAIKCNIDFPKYINGKYYINTIPGIQIEENNIYEYNEVIVDNNGYFNNAIIKFDENKGIICMGESIILETDNVIRINKNVICVVDFKNMLKCIYIIPDAFTK